MGMYCLFRPIGRAVDKGVFDDNFCKFCVKIYVVTPHLNRLDKTVQMRGHKTYGLTRQFI